MTATRTPMPELFRHADAEVVAHYKENRRRSYRALGRLAGCSHPHAKKILDAYRAHPGEIEAELARGGYLL
jgi:hypothetical protein